MSSKVSIVSVSYRSAQLMIDCLRSVENESATLGLSIRAFVIDNASGDYPALAQAVEDRGWASWVTLAVAPRNGGFAYGNNIGIRMALEERPCDYILLLNPDTQVRPGAILALLRFLETHPKAGIAGTSFEHVDGTPWPIAFHFPTMISEFCGALGIGPIIRVFRAWAVAQTMTAVSQPVDWICGAAMMIRPEVFRTIGGFDENYFLYFEETDFCFRARQAGFATWYVPEGRVMHIMGQSTKVTDPWAERKALPGYWFESRRRYFAVTAGLRRAKLIDLVVLVAYPIGLLKRLLAGKLRTAVPRYLREFWRHSILRRRNRQVRPWQGLILQDSGARVRQARTKV